MRIFNTICATLGIGSMFAGIGALIWWIVSIADETRRQKAHERLIQRLCEEKANSLDDPEEGREETGENVDYEFTDKDLKIKDTSTTDIADMMRYSMEDSDGCVMIRPMDGTGVITIHGKEEAVLFTNCLMDHFRRE